MYDISQIKKAVNKKYINNCNKDRVFDFIDYFFTCNEEPISSLYLIRGTDHQQYLVACPETAVPHLNKMLKTLIIDVIEIAEFGYDITVNELIDMGANFCDIELEK